MYLKKKYRDLIMIDMGVFIVVGNTGGCWLITKMFVTNGCDLLQRSPKYTSWNTFLEIERIGWEGQKRIHHVGVDIIKIDDDDEDSVALVS